MPMISSTFRQGLFILVSLLASATDSFCQKMIDLDTAPEGDQPELFAPGIISDEYGNRDMAISPSGEELFYTLQHLGGRGFSTIMYTKKINGKWTTPEVATFCGTYNDLEPAFSADGQKLYFVSNRPLPNSSEMKDYDIWCVEKKNGKWNDAKNLGWPVNTGQDEYYPSASKNGNLYFTRNMGETDEDIVMCKFSEGRYDTAVALPSTINSGGAEFNAFIDPGEDFIIFTGYKRKGNYGSGDLFISYRDDKGEWLEAKNMGNKINGPELTFCPYISPDKKYFFFTSSRGSAKPPFPSAQKIAGLKKLMRSPLNGLDNIYWIKAGAILEK